MIGLVTSWYRRASLRAVAGGLLLFVAAACSSGDELGPTAEAAQPADSTLPPVADTIAAPPTDSTVAAPTDSSLAPADSSGTGESAGVALDTRSALPGIVFATDNMATEYFNTVHTGSKLGGPISPTNVLSVLAAARAKGARLVLKFSKGADDYIQNSDGTFSFTKWKALVDRFKGVNLAPYIADGTIIGHFLIDEPHRSVKWGGKIIPHSTVEAMAQYSKGIWPDMNTFVHTQMGWLASTTITYRYLDAGWTQYAAAKGNVGTWATSEVSRAKSKGLGLMMGLNVLNGGDGSSGIRGTRSGRYSMSANELRKYGTTVLSQSYACAFIMWQHNLTYYGRSDMQSAMTELSVKAKSHAKTSCRQ